MEAQTHSIYTVSNQSKSQESQTVAAERKLTKKNILHVGRNPLTCLSFLCFSMVAKDALLFPY